MSVEGFVTRCHNRIKVLDEEIKVIQTKHGYQKVPLRLVRPQREEIKKLKEAIRLAVRKGITEVT